MIPNYLAEVEAASITYADAFRHAHVEGDPRRHEFIMLLAADLHAKDATVANNGKRGNPNDLSMDALNILCDEADSAGRTPEGSPCVVVDVIGGAGGPNPRPAWDVFATAVKGSGAWVKPGAAPTPPPSLKPRDQFYAEFRQINDFYGAQAGLQRPGGMVIDTANPVRCDHEAMGAWGYDLMTGTTVDEAISRIRHSDEWQRKHPGETP